MATPISLVNPGGQLYGLKRIAGMLARQSPDNDKPGMLYTHGPRLMNQSVAISWCLVSGTLGENANWPTPVSFYRTGHGLKAMRTIFVTYFLGRAMHRLIASLFLTLCVLWCERGLSTEVEAQSSIVFGQIQLDNGIPVAWRLVLKEVDTGATERITLELRKFGEVLYDFAAALPPGNYHLLMLTAPQIEWENRITDKTQYFEVKPGAVVYLGNWLINLGKSGGKTTYSIQYNMDEVGLFAKANPGIDPARFAVGVLGKPALPLKAQ